MEGSTVDEDAEKRTADEGRGGRLPERGGMEELKFKGQKGVIEEESEGKLRQKVQQQAEIIPRLYCF